MIRLLLVHALFRHGDRTPDYRETYPKDPYADYPFCPIGRGELTNRGKRTEYDLGEELRDRYGEFLVRYTPSVVFARSSDFNRTKASLELVLAGLFPPRGKLRWNGGLDWQPIPFYYKPISQDELFYADLSPAYQRAYENYTKSPEHRRELQQYEPVFQYLEENTGSDINNLRDTQTIYFCLTTQKEWGLRLPAWTKRVYPKELTKLASLSYNETNGNVKMLRFTAGPLLKKIVADTRAKIDGALEPRGRKIFLYSAHEKNVASLLIALGVFRPHVPSYGSNLAFEVYVLDGGDYGVKVLYQDGPGAKVETLNLPECEAICPFNRFAEICGKYF